MPTRLDVSVEIPDDQVDLLVQEVYRLVFKRMCDDSPILNPSRWLSAQDAGDYIGVSRQRIADLTYARKLLPAGYDGRSPRYDRAQLDAYLHGALSS